VTYSVKPVTHDLSLSADSVVTHSPTLSAVSVSRQNNVKMTAIIVRRQCRPTMTGRVLRALDRQTKKQTS